VTQLEDDLPTIRRLATQLNAFAELLGGYDIGAVQGYNSKATATVAFEKQAGPLATADGITTLLLAAPKLAQVCQRIIGHFDGLAPCTCEGVETGRGFEDCPVHDPEAVVAERGG